MTRSPIALALVAALGAGAALASAPALAQQGASMTVTPIRTGSSSIGGPFGVRLAVYDARSFELSWNRIPNATAYRVQVGSRTVQENGAISRFVGNADLSGGFDYTLTALDRAGRALASQRFRVQPASATQLVAAGGGTGTPTPPPPGSAAAAPANLRLQVYSGTAAELFWQPDSSVVSYEIRRDGVLIDTLSAGFRSSYFDDTRRPGRSYTYEVRATGSGRPPATVTGTGGSGTPTTPTDPTTPTVPTPPPAAGTAPPTNLRLEVYSSTAAELFWQPGTFVDRNQIRRDGVLIAELGGGALRSYFDNTRQPGRSYTYQVTAINGAGPASATIGATGGAGTPTSPTNPMAPVPPSNPTGGPIRTGQTSLPGDLDVRLSVYDARSYELFWFRVPGAARYRLSRDGRVVQESDAVSHFVGNADSTRRFEYTLEVLDRSDNVLRSRAFTVAPRGTPQLVETGGGTGVPTTPTTPPASTGGLPQAEATGLDRILALVNGDAVEKLTAFALRVRPDAPTLVATGRTGSVTIPGVGRDLATVEYRCRDGGTATVADPNPARTVVTYAGCRVGPLTASGRAESSTPAAAPAGNPGPIPPPFAGTVPFEMQLRDGFTMSDARDGSTIAASTVDAYERAELGGATARFTTFWDASDLRVTGPGGTVSSARPRGDVAYLGTPGAADGQPFFVAQGISPDFDATFSGPLGTVSIGTPRSFERDRAAGLFPNGTLAVAGRGVSYELDAGNGDPATFQLNVTRDGSTAAYTVPWSDRFELEPFRPDRVDLGF